MSALNPKVSLLVKLAEMVGVVMADMPHLDSDQEVIEWYDRMAELKYVPTRGVSSIHNAVLALAVEAAIDCGANVVESMIREGYQIFATDNNSAWSPSPVASYTEATSAGEALAKCLELFKLVEGYTNHGVKNIETQLTTMLASDAPKATTLSLD